VVVVVVAGLDVVVVGGDAQTEMLTVLPLGTGVPAAGF